MQEPRPAEGCRVRDGDVAVESEHLADRTPSSVDALRGAAQSNRGDVWAVTVVALGSLATVVSGSSSDTTIFKIEETNKPALRETQPAQSVRTRLRREPGDESPGGDGAEDAGVAAVGGVVGDRPGGLFVEMKLG
jgi:hypothetical protein